MTTILMFVVILFSDRFWGEVFMARANSIELRKRVVNAVVNGFSTWRVAAQFLISISTVGARQKTWQRKGWLDPGKQGKPSRLKLDEPEAVILSLLDTEERDITLAEITEALRERKGLKTCAAYVYVFFKKRGISLKKERPCVSTP